jgi:hypothetical protein
MADEMLNPIGYGGKAEKALAPRLSSLNGKIIALVDIGFPNSNIFLDRVETLLKDRFAVAEVVRHAKPSPTRMAKPEVRKDILSRCHGVIEAVSSWGSCISCSSHDVAYFEENGVPTANISTTEFVAAARLQCKNLGIPSYEVITVPHPIVPLTKEEVWSRADAIIDSIVAKLIGNEARAAAL